MAGAERARAQRSPLDLLRGVGGPGGNPGQRVVGRGCTARRQDVGELAQGAGGRRRRRVAVPDRARFGKTATLHRTQ